MVSQKPLSSRNDSESLDDLLSQVIKHAVPCDSSLPPRKPIPTYLQSLDRTWRGGWFWQWPIIIAGPENAGKSLFLAQLVASCLLSSPKPWQILYYDFNEDYQVQRILRVLNFRSQKQLPTSYLSRIDKHTLFAKSFDREFFKPILRHPMLTALVFDGYDTCFLPPSGLRGFATLASFKQMGFLVTLRGDLDKLLQTHPWEAFPYFCYITKLKHKEHRIRFWQNSWTHKIYDQVVEFRGYFREFRSKKRKKKASKPLTPHVYTGKPS